MEKFLSFLSKPFLLVVLLVYPFTSYSSINSKPQIINLNMQFKSQNKTFKTDLAMPFYQTAELEKRFDKKSFLIEVNPKHGTKANEVAIEMKFYKSNTSKAFAKKEVLAKIGEESRISVKGITVKVTPVL